MLTLEIIKQNIESLVILVQSTMECKILSYNVEYHINLFRVIIWYKNTILQGCVG
jgi:hypothetical protein